ncbi:flagellar M-ring protein FliF [Clostridium gasigenes]|uniref:flagellar basal-body MS-ring/collar protein FliF n=1 Tax=Clostridium gasigenes TaxID=94869 RepID=UPI001C0C9A1B|nr:flagellar basal-body MS-ring/collar protein FliF [Clostridium gasigenes]MBU3135980.1 flagellar M-ring protein FliF [Clostridium gasigenes]
MDKLKEGFKKLWTGFKALGKGVKIAIVIAIITLIIAIISMFFYSANNKYKVLFSGLDPNDAQLVTSKLKEKKVDMKIEGEAIMVPKENVDELRLEIAPELSTGSKGFELMDGSSSFGMTDEEFKIKKIRMQQGELEKTIKSFPQVDNVRVHITPSKDSVFVEDKEPGKAAVYLKLVAGNDLSTEQVSSIVALVSGSTENIPKENIEVVDDKMNLLTKDLNNTDESVVSSETIEKHYLLEQKYEKTLEKSILDLLQPVLGKKITTQVNVELDFDSKQETKTVIDPNKVIVSQQTLKEINGTGDGQATESPVDNNMGNTIADKNTTSKSSKEDQKTNYESGKTESKVISAPGEVKRLTATVFVDGDLDAKLQKAIENSVGTAIGFNLERGDAITIEGINFDPLEKDDAATAAMDEMLKAEQRNKIITYVVIGLLGLGIIITIIVVLLKKRRENAKVEEEGNLLDVVIEDRISKNIQEPVIPIDFGENNPKTQLEEEIKKYAQDKPEQVVDIVKSWLSENER